MLLNLGYDRESFSREFGFGIEEFIDERNWRVEDDKSVFYHGGVAYDIFFDYNSPVLQRR